MQDGRTRAFFIAYGVFLFGVFAYFMPAATWSPVSRLGLTRAVVERGSLDVDPWSEATGDRALRGGHWYSDKAPVPSFLALPAYFVDHAWDTFRGHSPQFTSLSTPEMPARRVIVNDSFARSLYVCSVSTSAVAGVAVALLVLIWLRRRFSPRTAFAGSIAMALGTPLLPYATSFYGHELAAAFLVGAFVLLTVESPSRPAVRAAGLLLVLAAGSEYLVTVPALVLVVASLARARRNAPVLALDLLLGAVLPAAAIGAYHAVCFGSPFATGYAFLPRAEFAEGHSRGFFGVEAPKLSAAWRLLVGPGRGLFVVAPIALVGTIGLAVRAVRGRFDERVASLAVLSLFLANAGYYMWWGGAATGPRHLVPVLPLLAAGVAWGWQYRWLRVLTIAVAALSCANMLAFTAVGLEAPEHGNSLVDYAWGGLFARRIAHLSGASNLGVRIGLPRGLSLAPLVVWLMLGLRYVIDFARKANKVSDVQPAGPTAPKALDLVGLAGLAGPAASAHSFVDGMSSMASDGVATSRGTAVSFAPVESGRSESSSGVDESSPLPKTRSSPEHAVNVVPTIATVASTRTPRGKRKT